VWGNACRIYPDPEGEELNLHPVASVLAEESLVINVTGKFSESGVENCIMWGKCFGNIMGKYFEKPV
jgi:hypothetical protein